MSDPLLDPNKERFRRQRVSVPINPQQVPGTALHDSRGKVVDGEFNQFGEQINSHDRALGPTPQPAWDSWFKGGPGPQTTPDAATRAAARKAQQTWPPNVTASVQPIGPNGMNIPALLPTAKPSEPSPAQTPKGQTWPPSRGVAFPPPVNNRLPGEANSATLAQTRTVRFAGAPVPGPAPALTGDAAKDRAALKAYDAAGVAANREYFAAGGGRVEAPAPTAKELWQSAAPAVVAKAGTGATVMTPWGPIASRDARTAPMQGPAVAQVGPGAPASAFAPAAPAAPAGVAGPTGNAGTPKSWAEVVNRSGKPLLRAPSGEQIDPSNPNEARKLSLSQQLSTMKSRIPTPMSDAEAKRQRELPPPKVDLSPAVRALWSTSIPGMSTNVVGSAVKGFNDLVLRNENTRDTRWADIVRRSRASGQNPVTAAAGATVKAAAPTGVSWLQTALGSRLTAEPQRAKPQTLQSPKAVLGL